MRCAGCFATTADGWGAEKADMGNRKVVITGLGLATALGLEVEENWRKALSGVSGVSKIKLHCAGKSPVQAAGQVSAEDWGRICSEFPPEAESEGERRTLFALWAAKKALSDAGLEQKGGDRSRFGVAIGSGLGINRLEDIHGWLSPDGKFDSARFAAELDRVNRESIIRNNASEPGCRHIRPIRPERDEYDGDHGVRIGNAGPGYCLQGDQKRGGGPDPCGRRRLYDKPGGARIFRVAWFRCRIQNRA